MTSENDIEKYKQALSKLAPSERRAIEIYYAKENLQRLVSRRRRATERLKYRMTIMMS